MSGNLHAPVALPSKRNADTHRIGWVGPPAGLDVFEKKKSLADAGLRTPDRPARRPVTMPTELSRLLPKGEKIHNVTVLSISCSCGWPNNDHPQTL